MEQQENIRPGDVQSPPENYLVWAILSTILCCLPLGIVSIIKSTEVNKKWQEGDLAGAKKSSEDAKKYAIWAAIAGVTLGVIYGILMAVGVLGAAGSSVYGY